VNRYLNITTVLGAAWWSTTLFTWATISDPHQEGLSFELSGTEISQTMVLTPAIVLLVALIARYRKTPNQVMIFAAVVSLWSAYLAFSLNPAASPDAIDGLEKLTGIAGTVGLSSSTLAPTAYLGLSLGVAVLSILAAFSRPPESKRLVSEQQEDLSDPKSLWDSQK
jgi:FtsH-binding integral membrane protein